MKRDKALEASAAKLAAARKEKSDAQAAKNLAAVATADRKIDRLERAHTAVANLSPHI